MLCAPTGYFVQSIPVWIGWLKCASQRMAYPPFLLPLLRRLRLQCCACADCGFC